MAKNLLKSYLNDHNRHNRKYLFTIAGPNASCTVYELWKSKRDDWKSLHVLRYGLEHCVSDLTGGGEPKSGRN